MFIVLLSNIVNASDRTRWVSLSNQKCETQPTLINLHPNEYGQEFHYYPFSVKLDRCFGSCNTLNDLSNKVCIPNKTKDFNLSVFNMITGINKQGSYRIFTIFFPVKSIFFSLIIKLNTILFSLKSFNILHRDNYVLKSATKCNVL